METSPETFSQIHPEACLLDDSKFRGPPKLTGGVESMTWHMQPRDMSRDGTRLISHTLLYEAHCILAVVSYT